MYSVRNKNIEEVIEMFSPYMDGYLYMMDLKENYFTISKQATERFALPAASFGNAIEQCLLFTYEEDRSLLSEDCSLMLKGEKKRHDLLYRWLDKNGLPIWINCRGGVIDDSDGKPHYLVGCINEAGKKQRADNLSGLLGEMELSTYILSYTEQIPAGFLMRIGIDNFGVVNDYSGMEYGNYVIKKVADCIRACVSEENQHLFYMTADEYVIADFSGSTREQAVILYQNICKKIADFIEKDNYKTMFTISAGIVDTLFLTGEYEQVLQLSKFALRQAKEHGKNTFYCFCQEEYEVYLRKGKIRAALHQSVEHNFEGFEVYYQPISNNDDGRIMGAEALMRFFIQDENGTQSISPAEFIPILEETGLILPAGKWILKQAVLMCSEVQRYIPGFQMNINVSYIQMIKSDIQKDILFYIQEYGLSPDCITIELTESGYLDNTPHFCKLRKALKENGIRFAIDDFGTGYSNLHCLSDLSPSYIKIDKSFTDRAVRNTYDYEMLIKIIEMAHRLNIQICIEGVEEQEVLNCLREIHADYIQGYLIGKPCNRENFLNRFVCSPCGNSNGMKNWKPQKAERKFCRGGRQTMGVTEIFHFFENINEYVYAADIDTHELVYMNLKLRNFFGELPLEEIQGKKCYELLQQKFMSCSMCNNDKLTVGNFEEWTYYNPLIKQYLMINDTLLEDTDTGKKYRLEIAVDISGREEEKKIHQKYQDTEKLVNEAIKIVMEEVEPERMMSLALKHLGEIFMADRAYVFEKNDSGGDDNTYEWVTDGVRTQKDFLQNLPSEGCKEWYDSFEKGKSVVYEDIAVLKEYNPCLYEILSVQNINSIVVSPLYVNKKAIGFLGLDNPKISILEYATNVLETISYFITSIIRRRDLMKKLTDMSYTDALTHLGNRFAMERHKDQWNVKQSIGIIYCDVTGLKHINDTKGHKQGDALLLRAAESLKEVFEIQDIFRIGGDEFLVICNGIAEQELKVYMEDLRQSMKEQDVNMALGAIWKKNVLETDFDDLMSQAEKLMYEEKAAYYKNAGADRRVR